ncbi:hypothetical protein WJX74_002772 [Apatococcus lobatus]|uniref:DUF7148 domain-containing protein n=2 Tax=Apatococcus TaxID=904362 RepID=A0AAW1TDV3_9CHLO
MQLRACVHRPCSAQETSCQPKGRPAPLQPGFAPASSRPALSSLKASRPTPQRRSGVVTWAKSGNDPHLQLATARLPSNVNVEEFKRGLYQWASSLTSSGRNMPFSLPIKTTHTQEGFEMSLLRIFDGEAKSVGDIIVTVEDEPQKGSVLFARFFEGDASFADRSRNIPSDPMKRVQEASSGLVDVPIIMQTMRDAIKRSAIRAR